MKPLKPTNLVQEASSLDAFEQSIQSKLYDLETIAPDFDFGKLSFETSQITPSNPEPSPKLEKETRRITTTSWLWMARAASVVMLLGIGGWTSFNILNNELPKNTTLAKVGSAVDANGALAITQANSSKKTEKTATKNLLSSLLITEYPNDLAGNGFVAANTSKSAKVTTQSKRFDNQVGVNNVSANATTAIVQRDSVKSNESFQEEESNQGEPQITRLSAGFLKEANGKERSSRELRKAAKQTNGEAQAALVGNSGSNIDLRNPVNTSARLVKDALTQRGVVTTEQYGNRKAVTVRIGGNVVRVAR